MNKFIGSLVAMAVLAGVASAAESTTGVTFGVNHVKINDKSAGANGASFSDTGFNLGVEKVTVYDNNFVFGYGANFGYTSTELGVNGDTAIYSLDTVVKLGYQPIPKATGYVIGGVEAQYIDYDNDPTTGYGFVYGVGAEYKVLDNLAVNVEYKTTKQSATGDVRDLDYDYATTGVNLKYIF